MLKLIASERVGTISKRSFYERYRMLRRPVLLSDFTSSWPARQKWSIEYLKSVAGHREIPVYDRRPSRGRQHQHAAAARMRLGEYLECLRAGECDLRIFFLRVVDELPEL